jgi:hypothetical protein
VTPAIPEGNILNRTNGFRGLMRFLRDAYLHLTEPGNVPSDDDFFEVFSKIDVGDDYFTTEHFKPGTSGESELHRLFHSKSGILVNPR